VQDWQVLGIEMVGRAPLAGVTYERQYRGRSVTLPVLPSDHYGLLVTLEPVGGSR
jgi:hypothetical protein